MARLARRHRPTVRAGGAGPCRRAPGGPPPPSKSHACKTLSVPSPAASACMNARPLTLFVLSQLLVLRHAPRGLRQPDCRAHRRRASQTGTPSPCSRQQRLLCMACERPALPVRGGASARCRVSPPSALKAVQNRVKEMESIQAILAGPPDSVLLLLGPPSCGKTGGRLRRLERPRN